MKNYGLLKQIFVISVFAVFALTANSQEYFSRISMEGVELMGGVRFGMVDKFTTMEPGFYLFKYDNRFQPERTNPLHRALVNGGSVYYEGKIYSNEYDNSGQMHLQKPMWRIYDANTFEVLSETQLNDNCENTTTSLAYDRTTDKIYGILMTFTEYFFVEIDPKTGATKRIAELDYGYKYVSLACNRAGSIYCIYFNKETSVHYLARIRKSDGKIANIGELEVTNLLPEDWFINLAGEQAMFFNNANDKLYWIYGSTSAYLDSYYTAIAEVNTTLSTATLLAYVKEADGTCITGAFLKEPFPNAPSIVTDFQFVPETEGALKGSLKFKLPESSYEGHPLSGKLTIIVKEGDKELIHTTADPGEDFTSDVLDFTNDNHTLSVQLINEQGEEGPSIRRSFYVGYDVPKACQNIKLVSEGLVTTLTWEPPVEGVNGAPINPDEFTYTVVRYPYEVIVSQGKKECTFVEEHPGDMTRYVYMVSAVNGSGKEGKSAFSNNLIVGTPLNPPYGGIFRDAADMYNYYTILDGNNDGIAWTYNSTLASAYCDYNPFIDADEWLISPPINYKKDAKYILTFNAYSYNAGYLESMEVKFGKGRTPETQNRQLLDLPEVPAVSESNPLKEYQVEFTVDEDGIYYYSFHMNSVAYCDKLVLFNIRLEEVPISAITTNNIEPLIRIHTGEGIIRIENPEGENIAIYNSNGKYCMRSDDTRINRQLPSGVYLVISNRKIYKAVVF